MTDLTITVILYCAVGLAAVTAFAAVLYLVREVRPSGQSVYKPLTAREEAHLEHEAFDCELIERMRDLGTLNHMACSYCRDHNIRALEGWTFGRITPGEITSERITVPQRRENTFETMIAGVLAAMDARS